MDKIRTDFLAEKMGLSQVRKLALEASKSTEALEFLWEKSHSDNRRISVNCLWILTHVEDSCAEWLRSRQASIIERLLTEKDASRKRIFLQLLKKQEFDPEEESSLRLLDFCLPKINSECEPYAVRCFSMYVAFSICHAVPELLGELEQHLELLSLQPLSPGLSSGLRQTRQGIARIRKQKAKPQQRKRHNSDDR